MTELRKQFEAMPEINKTIVSYNISFDDGAYNGPFSHINEWMNGAWYAFQEQQKKIDDFVNIINDAYMSNGNSSVEIVYDKIQELLK